MNSRNSMLFAASTAAACLWLLALVPACSKEEAPTATTQPQSPAAAPEQPAQPEPPATSTESVSPAQPLPDKTTPTGAETATPAPTRTEPAPSEPGSAAQPAAAPPPEPAVAEEPFQPGSSPAESAEPTHAAVGSEKCKMCHKIQYESWATSAHAKAAPPAGCETCHGNGADYVKMTVMKDPVKAKASGLVLPDTAFCTAKCHKPESFTDDMLRKAHAHKVR